MMEMVSQWVGNINIKTDNLENDIKQNYWVGLVVLLGILI